MLIILSGKFNSPKMPIIFGISMTSNISPKDLKSIFLCLEDQGKRGKKNMGDS